MGIELAGISRGAREGDAQEEVPPTGGGSEGVGWPSKEPFGCCGLDGRHTRHRGPLRYRWDGSCKGLQGKAERNVTHSYGPRGPMGPTSDIGVLHFGQMSAALRSTPGALLARGGLGAPARAPARSRARARRLRLDGAKSP